MSATEPQTVTVADRTVWEWRLQGPSSESGEAAEALDGFRTALEDALSELAGRDGVAAVEHCERDGLFEVVLTLCEGTPDSWAWQVRDCTQLLEGIDKLTVVASSSRVMKRAERQPKPPKGTGPAPEMCNLDSKDSKLEAALLARIDVLVQQHAQTEGAQDRSSTLAQIMDELKSGRHPHPEFTGTEALVALAESQGKLAPGQAETQLHGSALRLIEGRLSAAESRCKLAIESTVDSSPVHVLFPARSERDRLLRCHAMLSHAVEEIESCRHLCSQFTDFMVACALVKSKESAAAEEAQAKQALKYEKLASEAEERCKELEACQKDAAQKAKEAEERYQELEAQKKEAATKAQEAEEKAAKALERAEERAAEEEARCKAALKDTEAAKQAEAKALAKVAELEAGGKSAEKGDEAKAKDDEAEEAKKAEAKKAEDEEAEAKAAKAKEEEEAKAKEEEAEKEKAEKEKAEKEKAEKEEAEKEAAEKEKAEKEKAEKEAAEKEKAEKEAAEKEEAEKEEEEAAEEEEAEAGEEGAKEVKEGQWYVVHQESLDIWESTSSWETVGSLSQGDCVQAAGPTEDADGIDMLPILPSGAVEFACLTLWEEDEEAEAEGEAAEAEADAAEEDPSAGVGDAAAEEADAGKGVEETAIVLVDEDAKKDKGVMDVNILAALMSKASQKRAGANSIEEGITVKTHEHVLKPFDDGNRRWSCDDECAQCSRIVEGPKVRWSCRECEYDLCRGCAEFHREQAIVVKEDKNKKPWSACSIRDAEGTGLPVAVVVKDAKEEWLNGTLLLSSTLPSLEERGAYVYGAFSERAEGNWPYMWFDAKALKWKFSSWQKGQTKAPSLALCRAENQSVAMGVALGDWTLSKGPKTILPMTVTGMTEEEFWSSEAREMVPMDLSDVLSVVSNTAANLLEEDLHLDTPFMESGFTSAMAVQFRMLLNGELAVNLPATLMFDQPNMRSIGHYIVDLSKN